MSDPKDARIAALEAENARLKAIIQRYMNTYPAFRMKPIGAPHRIATRRIAPLRHASPRIAPQRIASPRKSAHRNAEPRNATHL